MTDDDDTVLDNASVNSQDQGKIVMNLGHTSVTSHFTSIVSVCQ